MQNMAQNRPMGEDNTARNNVSIALITREVPLPWATTPVMGTMVGSVPIVVNEPCKGGPSQQEHHVKFDPLLTKETTKLLKNMKPPILKGEEGEHIKDLVNIVDGYTNNT